MIKDLKFFKIAKTKVIFLSKDRNRIKRTKKVYAGIPVRLDIPLKRFWGPTRKSRVLRSWVRLRNTKCKMTKNAFYIILKALLKYLNFCPNFLIMQGKV